MTALEFNPPGNFTLRKRDAARFGRKGGHATAARQLGVYMIEGETVTAGDVAARLGLALSTTQRKIKAAQRQPGPVTWKAIREAGK